MAAKEIRILGALQQRQVLRRGSLTRNQMFVEITAPDLVAVLDESKISKAMAIAIDQQIGENFRTGKQPDGTPLPQISPATKERRHYRDLQAYGAGVSRRTVRIKNGKRRREAARRSKKAWKRRFVTSRIGTFDPRTHGDKGWFGVESGMLIRSRALAKDGDGWRIYFADNRALKDAKGSSAVERVFSRIPIWTQRAMEQRPVKETQKAVADEIVVDKKTGRSAATGKPVHKSLEALLRESMKALSNVQGLADSIEDAGDAG